MTKDKCQCTLSNNIRSHKTILDWFEHECMEMDESCMMAGDTLMKLDRLFRRDDISWDDIFDERESLQIILCNGQEAGWVLTKKAWPDMEGREGVYMDELFLHPEFRGRGCGRFAIDKQFENPEVEFVSGNSLDQAFKFWENLGAIMAPFAIHGKKGFHLYREDYKP